MQLIDSHLHFFAPQEGDYHWLQPDKPPHWPDKAQLYQAFDEAALNSAGPCELRGLVHIEAGFDNARPWREVAWWQSRVQQPLRCVAGIDLLGKECTATLTRLADYVSVVGVRHILDNEAVAILSQPQVRAAFAALAARDWHFEAQYPVADDTATDLLLEHVAATGVRCVINHAGWAPQDAKGQGAWQANLARLAACPHIAIKASGWEMLGSQRQWSEAWAQTCWQQVLSAFGPQRVMAASNFPLCRLACSYAEFWRRTLTLLNALALDAEQQQAVLHDNAARWYQFD